MKPLQRLVKSIQNTQSKIYRGSANADKQELERLISQLDFHWPRIITARTTLPAGKQIVLDHLTIQSTLTIEADALLRVLEGAVLDGAGILSEGTLKAG